MLPVSELERLPTEDVVSVEVWSMLAGVEVLYWGPLELPVLPVSLMCVAVSLMSELRSSVLLALLWSLTVDDRSVLWLMLLRD